MAANPDEMPLPDLVEQPEVLLALEPEEIAGALLRYLVILSSNKRDTLNRDNFCRMFQGETGGDVQGDHRSMGVA
jgi:hypothetical protein